MCARKNMLQGNAWVDANNKNVSNIDSIKVIKSNIFLSRASLLSSEEVKEGSFGSFRRCVSILKLRYLTAVTHALLKESEHFVFAVMLYDRTLRIFIYMDFCIGCTLWVKDTYVQEAREEVVESATGSTWRKRGISLNNKQRANLFPFVNFADVFVAHVH